MRRRLAISAGPTSRRDAAAALTGVSSRALARSALHINALQLVEMGSRLILTPIVIARLGLEGYGVWILLFRVAATAATLNIGVLWAYTKLSAELDQQQDYGAMSRLISSGAALMTATAAALLAALWHWRLVVLPVVGVPAALLTPAAAVLALLSAAVLIDTSLGSVVYVLAGVQRTDLQYRLRLYGAVVELVVAVPLLWLGAGMPALAAGFLLSRVVLAGGAWLTCRRLRPAFTLSPRHLEIAALRRLMPLGIRMQGVVLLTTLVKDAVRLALSALYGATALGGYQLADRLLFVARFPSVAVLNPLMPAFSGLAARGEERRWHRLFTHASIVAAVAAALPILFTAVFADAILFAWTGHNFPDAAWTVRVLAPAELAAALSGVAVAALRAGGTVALELRFLLAAGVLSLLGAAAGYPLAGYAGSVAAIAGARSGTAAWLWWRLPRAWVVDRRAYARRTVLGSALAVIPAVVAAKAAAAALSGPSGRWHTLAALVGLGAASAGAVAAATWWGLLSTDDRDALRRGE